MWFEGKTEIGDLLLAIGIWSGDQSHGTEHLTSGT